jgi:uncharacterized protein (DUF2141 family)
MKMLVFFMAVFAIPIWTSAQIGIRLKIEGAEKNGGKIYVSVFNSDSTYKAREVYESFSLKADTEIVSKELNLPTGNYVFSIYQDSNGNGKLDTNLIGIPREKFGFSNYDGKSVPGSFNRHRIEIKEGTNEVVVSLFKI